MTDVTPPAAPQSSAPVARGTNALAVVGFVLAIFGFNVIAIILAAIGLSQIKRTGESGRGFALAAIWIAIIEVVLFVVIIVVVVIISASAAVSSN
jgi:hypothetical protein